MEDPRIVVAIITASIALILGLVNSVFTIISLNSRNKNEKEVQLLKANLENERIKFQRIQQIGDSEENFKAQSTKRILNTLQVLIDSCYSLKFNIKTNNGAIHEKS